MLIPLALVHSLSPVSLRTSLQFKDIAARILDPERAWSRTRTKPTFLADADRAIDAWSSREKRDANSIHWPAVFVLYPLLQVWTAALPPQTSSESSAAASASSTPSASSTSTINLLSVHREQMLACMRRAVDASADAAGKAGAQLPVELSRQLYHQILRFLAGWDGATSSDDATAEVLKREILLTFIDLMDKRKHRLLHEKDLTFADRASASSQRYRLSIAHWISVALNWLESERDLTLRELCARSLEAALCALGDASVVVNVLPGISTAVVKCLMRDAKKSPWFVVSCLQCLRTLLRLVFDDRVALVEDDATLGAPPTHPIANIVRNAQWLKDTRPQIQRVIQHVSAFRAHADAKVRVALGEWSADLLETCRQSFGCDTAVMLVGNLIVLSVESSSISHRLARALDVIAASADETALTLRIQEDFRALIDSLPSVMMSVDDAKRMDHLALVNGHFAVFPADTCRSVVATCEEDILDAMLRMFEPDTRDVALVADRSMDGPRMISNAARSSAGDTTFAHFQSPALVKHLIALIGNLAESVGAARLIDRLLERRDNRASSYRILLHVIPLMDDLAVISYAPTLMADLLDANMLQQPTSATHAQSKLSIEDYTRNIIEIQLAMETVSVLARRLGCKFEQYLMNSLVPVLEILGHPNNVLSCAAWDSLDSMAKASGAQTVDGLLAENMDYIVDSITTHLRFLDLHPTAPRMLLALLTAVGTGGRVELLADAVEEMAAWMAGHQSSVEVLRDICRNFKEIAAVAVELIATADEARRPVTNAASIEDKQQDVPAKILAQRGIAGVIIPEEEWHAASSDMREYVLEVLERRAEASTSAIRDRASLQEIGAYFEERQRMKDAERAEALRDVDDRREDEADVEEGDTRRPPLDSRQQHLVRLVHTIVSAVEPFLAVADVDLHLQVMRVIHTALPVLARKKSDILAFLNANWFPLLSRLSPDCPDASGGGETYVILETIGILTLAMELCGDFLARKFSDHILPVFEGLLLEHRSLNRAETAKPEYRFSPAYRVQCAVVDALRVAVDHDCVTHPAALRVVAVCAPLMDRRLQNIGVCDATESLMVTLARHDGDAVAACALEMEIRQQLLVSGTRNNGDVLVVNDPTFSMQPLLDVLARVQ